VSINVGSAFDLRKILPAGGVAGLSETFYDQTGPPPSPLLQNEVEFWTLGEAPGNPRLGSLGAFGLTPTGAVGRAAGLIGNAASFDGSAMWLANTSAGLSVTGKDWTFTGWFYFAAPGLYGLAGKDESSSLEWSVYGRTDNGFATARAYDGVSVRTVSKSASLTTATWYFFAVYYDKVTRVLSLDVNNSGSPATVTLAGDIPVGTDRFAICQNQAGFDYLNGRANLCGLWASAPGAGGKLSAANQTLLYNAGAGLTYPFG